MVLTMQYDLLIRNLGVKDYQETWKKMKDFTDFRNDSTLDEVWLLQHPPVFTQGLAGKPEHILNPHAIPVIQTDRGGQVTYHGPGQLVVYILLDLKRQQMHARQLVRQLEKSVVDLLATLSIHAQPKCDAPGVYIDDAKICSIGLRVRKNCSYHGMALNVDMDLTPFAYINPCGYSNLKMTQIKSFVTDITFATIQTKMMDALIKNFGYQHDRTQYV